MSRRWIHSHEEDTGDELVFRPEDYTFPPARGRTEILLDEGGEFAERAPGPVDVPVESSALREEGWEIAEVAEDRLTLRRAPPPPAAP